MSFKTIKWILKKHIDTHIESLWIWKKHANEFKCVYGNYNGKHRVYTAEQLLSLLNS